MLTRRKRDRRLLLPAGRSRFRNLRGAGACNAARLWAAAREQEILSAAGAVLQSLRASLSNRPSMLGQSKPTCAARELSLCASSSDGMAEETPARIDWALHSLAALPPPAAWRFFFSSALIASQLRMTSEEVSAFHVTKHMRMAINELGGEPVEHIVDREC